jgi:hypothetical protein
MSCQLRSGYTPHYALLHEHAVNYGNSLRDSLNLTFPRDSLFGHLEFHKVLVRFVAGVLVAAGEHPGVNDKLSAIAFNETGLQFDERLPSTPWLSDTGLVLPRLCSFTVVWDTQRRLPESQLPNADFRLGQSVQPRTAVSDAPRLNTLR